MGNRYGPFTSHHRETPLSSSALDIGAGENSVQYPAQILEIIVATVFRREFRNRFELLQLTAKKREGGQVRPPTAKKRQPASVQKVVIQDFDLLVRLKKRSDED
jgi:hypothetical protein